MMPMERHIEIIKMTKDILRDMARCQLMPNASEVEHTRGRKLWAASAALEEMIDEYAVSKSKGVEE